MAQRNIIKENDPLLRKKCREVTNYDIRLATLLDDMRETMHLAEGIGLAAPQIGILRRVAIVEIDDFFVELINPKITKFSTECAKDIEGCLSVDDYRCYVDRPEKITIEAYNRFGKKFKMKLEGLQARACQHELDHLDGVLFIDKNAGEVI